MDVVECLLMFLQGWGEMLFFYDRGERWLVWCWSSEEARHPPRLSVNVQLPFEEVAVGERTTDLRMLAGHKVTHTVSTQSASQSNSSQARDYGGPQQGQDRNMSAPWRFSWFIMPNTKPGWWKNSAVVSTIISQSGSTTYAVTEWILISTGF